MDFKKLLDDYMKQLDCTAKDLAEKSGLSAATISRYRSGDRIPEDGSENFARLINGIVSIAESKGIPDITVQSVSDAFSPYVRNSVDIVHFQKISAHTSTISSHNEESARCAVALFRAILLPRAMKGESPLSRLPPTFSER